MKKILLICILVCSFLLPVGSFAQGTKIGCVNSKQILNDYSETKTFNKEMEARDSRVMKEIEEKTKRVRKLRDDIELLSDKAKKKKQTELRGKIKELDEFRKAQVEGLIQWRDAEILKIRKSILDVIFAYAKQNGYDMVCDETAYVYVDGKYDITTDIIKELNKR